jgi:hypothetical protein
MLGKTYRLVVLNESGAAFTALTCYLEPWKLGTDGSITYGSEITVAGLSTTLADDAADASDTIDNSTNKYMGFNGIWSFTVGTTQSGTASIYLQQSPDGGTDWPTIADLTVDEVEGILLGTIKLNSQTTRVGQIEF